MGRSKFGKWVTVEHAAHVICEYQRRLAAAEAEREANDDEHHNLVADLVTQRDRARAKLAAAEADILAWQTTATYCGEIRDEALAKLAAAEALLRDREEAANWCFHWICTVKHFREAFEHWPWLRDHGDTTRSKEGVG
jgi:hypothetical protein